MTRYYCRPYLYEEGIAKLASFDLQHPSRASRRLGSSIELLLVNRRKKNFRDSEPATHLPGSCQCALLTLGMLIVQVQSVS